MTRYFNIPLPLILTVALASCATQTVREDVKANTTRKGEQNKRSSYRKVEYRPDGSVKSEETGGEVVDSNDTQTSTTTTETETADKDSVTPWLITGVVALASLIIAGLFWRFKK